MIKQHHKWLISSLLLLICGTTISQTIKTWTEQNGLLGLGYPVPIPEDTPEPFDGFRSYNGLFTKHQSMALNNDYITGYIVGQTHYNRDIWAYLLSDTDNVTPYGVKEGAMMANGGIHAREWQSPETLTQIITDFHERSDDHSFYQYLLENAAIITIPVNNVDGFLMTQRYPTENWYTDNIGPRDGRMRRKNLLDTDEDLFTQNDFLFGVDLNRNNPPYWATSSGSSNMPTSLIYHGPQVNSEPETQARLNAAQLVDADQLRIYTDIHSFSMVHYANKTFSTNLNTLQTRVLNTFTKHHKNFPAGKNYVDRSSFTTAGYGIGSTDEYFQTTYQIPSWTLEIEPSGSLAPDAHPNLQGHGVDYGGFGNNGHDGFILPESEIKRVREQLAETFMVVWYGQAGPPSITQMRIIDTQYNTIVFDAEWDIQDNETRALYSHYFDEIVAGKQYSLVIRFDKPMRYRDESGKVVNIKGQFNNLIPSVQAIVNDEEIELNLSNHRWSNVNDNAWDAYKLYKDDTFIVDFSIDPSVTSNGDAALNWYIFTADMVGQNLDANPATVATWLNGQWQNYEDSFGNSSIAGGFDTTMSITVSQQDDEYIPLLGGTALYFDPNRSGEGFNIETINSGVGFLLQWYTYDQSGKQQWYIDAETRSATNAIHANNLISTTGGVFGADFDSDNIVIHEGGNIEIIFEESRANQFGEARFKYTYADGRKFRSDLIQLTEPQGKFSFSNIPDPLPVGLSAATISGSWFDPSRNGEGFHIEYTLDGLAVFLWYSYDLDGSKKWFIGSGGVVTETADNINIVFDNVNTTSGGQFGEAFNPEDVVVTHWGRVEFNLQCVTGTVTYDAVDEAYGQGTYDLVPITKPSDVLLTCN